MNNWQLLVAAGFPTATGLVAIALALVQSGKLDSRIDRLEGRIDKLDDKIERLEAKIDLKLEKLETKMDLRFDSIQRDQREFYAIQRQHDSRIEALERNKQ